MWLTRSLLVLLLVLASGRGQEEDEASEENEELKSDEFQCPSESDGYYPHPEFCDRYFECREGKLVKKRLCGDGLAFDPDKNPEEDPCDHIHNIKGRCKSRPKLQKPQPGDSFCPRQNGVYPSPNPSECSTFYSCLNGVGSIQQCADGLHFDPSIGTCVWARESSRKGCNLQSTSETQKSEPAESDKDGESLANGFKCPGGKLGVHPAFPHPESCRLYYVCLNGVTPNEAGCTSGLVFNKETGKCDDPKNVPGCEETYESSKKPDTPAVKTGPVDQETADDLAKLLTLLSNPKLKTFLKPEIVDALGISDEDKPEADEAARVGPSPRQVSLPGSFKRLKRPQLQKAESTTEEAKVEKDQEGELNLIRPTRLPIRRNNFTSKFIPKVRPTLNRFRPKPAQQDEQPSTTTTTTASTSTTSSSSTTTTLPSIIEVFPERTTESDTPETSTTTTTSTTSTTTTGTTTETTSEQSPPTSPKTRLRFPRPNAFRGVGGQGFRRPKPSEDTTEGVKPESEPEKTEEEKKIASLKEEKIKNLLAVAANPNGQKKDAQEDAPADFHDFLTNFRKKKVQEGRDRFRPRPNLRVRPGKTTIAVESSTPTEAATSSSSTTTTTTTELPTTTEGVTEALDETTTSTTTTTTTTTIATTTELSTITSTSTTTTEIITELPTTIAEQPTITTEVPTTTTISTTSEPPTTLPIEPETTTNFFSFQPTRRPITQNKLPIVASQEELPQEIQEIFQQPQEPILEQQQPLNDPLILQQPQEAVIEQQLPLNDPLIPQQPQEAVIEQQQPLNDPFISQQQPLNDPFISQQPHDLVIEQQQPPKDPLIVKQLQEPVIEQLEQQPEQQQPHHDPSILQQPPLSLFQPSDVQETPQVPQLFQQSRPSSLPSSVITPPPLKADEQGQFEYVYYYEYEYEDDDKNGTNQAPKNTLPASLLNEHKPQPQPQPQPPLPTPTFFPPVTQRTTLPPLPSPTTTTTLPPPIVTRAPIVQTTSQRSPVTSPRNIEAAPIQSNPKFPHFSSFPLLTDRPDGIIKPDIPKTGFSPALKSPAFNQVLTNIPSFAPAGATLRTSQTPFSPEVDTPQIPFKPEVDISQPSQPIFTPANDEDYDYSDEPLEEKPRSQDSFAVVQNSPQFSLQDSKEVEVAPERPAVTNGVLIQPLTPIPSEPSTTSTTQSSTTTTATTTTTTTEATTAGQSFTPSFLPTIPTQRPQAQPAPEEAFELNHFEVDQEALQIQSQQREPVGFPRPPQFQTPSTESPDLESSPPRAPVPIQAPPASLVRPSTSFESSATFDSFPQQPKPEPSKFVRFEDPDFLTVRPTPQASFPLTAPPQQSAEPSGQSGFKNNVVSPQSSSFFNFQRPSQSQLPSNTFSPEQFDQFRQLSPQSKPQPQFNRFPQQNQFSNSQQQPQQQQSQFSSPQQQQQQSQFSNFQQQSQQNRFPSQSFTAFNTGNPPARFAERPSPAIGPGSFSPGSQLQQAFFSVFPQRAQRAIPQNGPTSEAEGDEHHFPEFEFGGFLPVSDQHHQKQTDSARPTRDIGSLFKKFVKRV